MSDVPGRLLRETLQAGMSGESPGCVDAEMVARWADDTLTRKERAAVEAHAAGCARCQSMLAAMARTAPPAVARSWFRSPLVAWVAPLTAVAAALLIYVSVAPRSRSSAPAAAAQIAARQVDADQAGRSASLSGERQSAPASQAGPSTEARKEGTRAKVDQAGQAGRAAQAGQAGQPTEVDRGAVAEMRVKNAREARGAALAKALASQARAPATRDQDKPSAAAPAVVAEAAAPAPSPPPAAANAAPPIAQNTAALRAAAPPAPSPAAPPASAAAGFASPDESPARASE